MTFAVVPLGTSSQNCTRKAKQKQTQVIDTNVIDDQTKGRRVPLGIHPQVSSRSETKAETNTIERVKAVEEQGCYLGEQ